MTSQCRQAAGRPHVVDHVGVVARQMAQGVYTATSTQSASPFHDIIMSKDWDIITSRLWDGGPEERVSPEVLYVSPISPVPGRLHV